MFSNSIVVCVHSGFDNCWCLFVVNVIFSTIRSPLVVGCYRNGLDMHLTNLLDYAGVIIQQHCLFSSCASLINNIYCI